jgi:hypothetical protein
LLDLLIWFVFIGGWEKVKDSSREQLDISTVSTNEAECRNGSSLSWDNVSTRRRTRRISFWINKYVVKAIQAASNQPVVLSSTAAILVKSSLLQLTQEFLLSIFR